MRTHRVCLLPIVIAMLLFLVAGPSRAFSQDGPLPFDGTHVPAFSFAMLMDTTQFITDKDLLGAPYILFLGNAGLEDLQALQAVYDSFHEDGLEIVSVWPCGDLSRTKIPPDNNAVRALRNDGFPLPWRHAQASESETRGLVATVQSGKPWILLISPDGSILASGPQMKGKEMENTVKRYFDGK